MKVSFNDEAYNVLFERENNGLNILLQRGEKRILATARDEYSKYTEAVVNNAGDNQGIEDALIEAGIIHEKISRVIDCGFITHRVHPLTPAALKELSLQVKLGLKKAL